MKKLIYKFGFIVCTFSIICILSSCGNNDDSDETIETHSLFTDSKMQELLSVLPGNTWKYSTTWQRYDGTVAPSFNMYIENNTLEYGETRISYTFQADHEIIKNGALDFFYSTSDNDITMTFDYGGWRHYGNFGNISSGDMGFLINCYGLGWCSFNESVITISENKVEIHRLDEDKDYDYIITLTKKGSGNLIGGHIDDGGSSSNDFYENNFTSTEYSNKIEVKFYFSEKLSSATIQYGTTSSCSSSKTASVSGVCASATITGLKANTKYYFKCKAKSKDGQSCTTEVYPAMTN